MAESIGIRGIRLEDSAQVDDGIASAFSYDGPVLIDAAVNRSELAMPPSITLEMAKGFSLFMVKAIMNGRVDEIIDLAKPSAISVAWLARGVLYGRTTMTWPMLSRDRNAPDLEQPPAETGKTIPAFPPAAPAAPKRGSTKSGQPVARAPAIIVTVLVSAIFGLSLWYLVQPQPLLVQGEADATRIDIAARVEGRVAKRPVSRGENVAAGAVLYVIDNPELLTSLREAEAAKTVAAAELAHIQAGTRAEVIAQRKAAVDSAAANLTLAQHTYGRTKQLVADGHSPQQRLDEVADQLEVAQRSSDQAKLAYQEAVAGPTKEERGVAHANVVKAQASIDTIKAQVDELVVRAPVASQVYQIGAELGDYVSPGVPLLSLVDLTDVWLRFNLREDLVKGLKVGDRFQMHVPALGNRLITAAVKFIAPKGEYAGWRATRATGDFDLRTFEVRAYPVELIPELRPGMSVYTDWRGARP
jgi:HlyD family secretion protein